VNNGFIKLFRCIEDSFFWNDSEAVHLWITILLSANHKDREILLNGKKTVIKSGQFICSRLTLSRKTGINESKIQRMLKLFESERMIEQQMNSKNRIISVGNWHKYQGSEQISEQQMNSKRTADEQQMNTNNNEKNEENKEKDTIVSKKKVGETGVIEITNAEFDKLKTKHGDKLNLVIAEYENWFTNKISNTKRKNIKKPYLYLLKWDLNKFNKNSGVENFSIFTEEELQNEKN